MIYTGLRQKPAEKAAAPIQEDMAVIGLSILSGAHVSLTRKVVDALRQAGASDIRIVVGETISNADIPKLKAAGAVSVYPTSTALSELVDSLRALVADAIDN